ncbi:HlyD family efflux transporter periplasmic adaptor subunit [Clostridium pasteurianum]|uniref:HlyD family secretion protein n=1 Tax=Clostridium pasteurianum TaxID=1501 RepID=UPI002260CDE2|nr:HlyD family efflux transporter periplasmic adaptor subunit [Clostridium pasteurianum]UZW15571.1 HlyD family efflux transporter periplasmic adaptor subunit [Clostridium pasteurianum]
MKVYDLQEITDSRVLYDKNPPKFMVYIILLVVALAAGFLIWADRSIKTYVVKGQGVVTTENKVNVMSNISAAIQDVYVTEGKDVKEGDVLLTLRPEETNLQLEQVNKQVDYDNKRIELLTRGEKYAAKGSNGFDRNNSDEIEFYNRLLNNYSKKGEYTVDEKSLKTQGYTEDQIKQAKESQKTKLNELYYETIMSFTNEKTQLQADKSKLEAQKSALENSIGAYKITAPKTGKIHLSTPITKGMVLQAGNLLGSINNHEEGLIIDVSVPSSDRPRIKLGDEVSLAVAGLNQAEYGTVKGKVISIDQDATVNSEKGNIYFNVKVKPEKTLLKDKKGEKVNLTLGMLTETRVKYEKITYMKYFLEQIGIKFD